MGWVGEETGYGPDLEATYILLKYPETSHVATPIVRQARNRVCVSRRKK